MRPSRTSLDVTSNGLLVDLKLKSPQECGARAHCPAHLKKRLRCDSFSQRSLFRFDLKFAGFLLVVVVLLSHSPPASLSLPGFAFFDKLLHLRALLRCQKVEHLLALPLHGLTNLGA